MANTGNIVRFLHFTGSESLWNAKINVGSWENAIVFGYIYNNDNNEVISRKIYAGKDSLNLHYIFEYNNNKKELIVVNTYALAEEYIQGELAEIGLIILVKSGDEAGNYIIVADENNQFFLEILQHKGAKWVYGGAGWHNESDIISNEIGLIKKGITLGQLIALTNDGEFSRIIEMMLFTKPIPTITTFTVKQTEGDEFTSITVKFEVMNVDSTLLIVKHGSTEIERKTTTGEFIFNNLTAGQTYSVEVSATNEVKTVEDNKSITTKSYVLPVVTMSTTTEQVSNTNKMHINSLSKNIVENDYNVDSISYTLKLDNQIILNNVTEELIKEQSLDYAKTYTLICNYNATNKFVETDVQHKTSQKSILMSLPMGGTIVITKINGAEIGELPILSNTGEYEIKFKVTPRLATASNVDVFVNNEKIKSLSDEYVADSEYTTSIELEPSSNVLTLLLKVQDEYNSANLYFDESDIIQLKFEKIMRFLTTIITKDENSGHYYDQVENDVTSDDICGYISAYVGETTVENFIETILNEEFDILGDGTTIGMLLHFLEEAHYGNLVDIKTMEYVDSNAAYKLVYGSIIEGEISSACIYVYVPDEYKLEFYADEIGQLGQLIESKESSKLTTLLSDGNQYRIVYIPCDDPSQWGAFDENMNIWVKIIKK